MSNQPAKRPTVIAIDGPGASGKSTVGQLVAQRLGYEFIDTGGMYRALTWLALLQGLDLEDERALVRLAEATPLRVLPGTPDQPGGRFYAGGEDLSPHLHRPDVDAKVSLIARVPGVRRVLVETQRHLASDGGVVMAGRDIGTVVLPHADLKVYLQASLEERAHRRFRELRGEGVEITYEAVLEDLVRRDEIDQRRAASPLMPAGDARIVETDNRTPGQIAKAILDAACIVTA